MSQDGGSLSGAIVPHAPLLLIKVSPDGPPAVRTIRRAVGDLHLEQADVVVILSPHGPRAGVYERPAGSLHGFGVNGVELERDGDAPFAEELGRAWGHPKLLPPADHGVVVPLGLAALDGAPVVAAAVVESTGPYGDRPQRAIDEAVSFAEALRRVGAGKRIAFVASANTGAGLSPRAPLSERAEALRVEDELLERAPRDAGELVDLALRLGRKGGSCGAAPLAAFGTIFAGSPLEVRAYERPYGVGHLVATANA
jgi:hypothetical protein